MRFGGAIRSAVMNRLAVGLVIAACGLAGACGGSAGTRRDGGADVADASDAGDLTGQAATGDIYVSPRGDDANPGTAALPVQTLQRAQQLVRGRNQGMTADLNVFLADGYYRMKAPLVMDASDSGSGGHAVIWTAAAGARPVLVGSTRIAGWSQVPGSNNIWVAQGSP